MKINLEITNAIYLEAKEEIENLKTKEYVPKMVFRRRLTRAAKLVVEAVNKIGFENGRIMYSNCFGELKATSNILNAILNEQMLSPTDFQNSVYNAAVSYLSILTNNQNEIMTISSGDESSDKLLKLGAIKALDGDEILLLATETMNIDNINEINYCIDYLEVVVALKVKITTLDSTIKLNKQNKKNYPKSIAKLVNLAKNFDKDKKNIIELCF